jgi:hypothetical protein
MTNGRAFDIPANCQIRVAGSLEDRWADWFDGFTIQRQPGSETFLCGQVADQAALHGILAKILDLGRPLLSLRCAPAQHADREAP